MSSDIRRMSSPLKNHNGDQIMRRPAMTKSGIMSVNKKERLNHTQIRIEEKKRMAMLSNEKRDRCDIEFSFYAK